MNNELQKDYGVLVAKKSERLVTALYLVTDLIDERDAIKQSLRKSSVCLLSSMNTLAQADVKDRVTELKVSLRVTTEILSLLYVSLTSGIISEMNGGILIDGFRSLQLVLEKKIPILNEGMLYVDGEDSLQEEVAIKPMNTTSYDVITPRMLLKDKAESKPAHDTMSHTVKNHENKEMYGYNKRQLENSSYVGNNIKDESSVVGNNQNIFRHTSISSSLQNRKSNRKEQILKLFVKGIDISIKDISARVKGCSEKTIQRELNDLVFEGNIERIGEKRWSRYILR